MRIRGEILEPKQALVMGILNLTPDSFYDGNEYSDEKSILTRVEGMVQEGADIIDLGGYSSRPGAENISEEEEWLRLEKPLQSIRKEYPEIILSIDTFRSGIAKRAVDQGGDIINDISGGVLDEEMLNCIAELQVPYVLMHMKGNPQNMQKDPLDKDAVSAVYRFFSAQLKKTNELGINDIILDPGFGFGKSLEGNYRLMKALKELKAFGRPILTGVSRKSMINKVLETKPRDALNGTTVLNTLALLQGADILRVHDVKPAKEAVKIISFYQKL